MRGWLTIGCGGCMWLLLACTPLASTMRQSANSTPSDLAGQLADDLAPYTHFTPEGICFSTPDQRDAYTTRGLIPALAQIMAEPQAAVLSGKQLETIIAEGIELAEVSGVNERDILPQVVFVTQQDDNFLVNIRLRYCPFGDHDAPPWEVHIFDRMDGYWKVGNGWLDVASLAWQGDRWTYLVNTSQLGQSNWVFAHAAQTTSAWHGLTFQDIPHAPNLVWFNSKPDLKLLDGYQKITVSGVHVGHSPPPCDISGDAFASLPTKLNSMTSLKLLNTVYIGTLTYVWRDNNYRLTQETPYEARVILTDYTHLTNVPPDDDALAKDAYLRPQSWRAFCSNFMRR